MATGTYDATRWNTRDKLRFLFRDAEVEEGETDLTDATFSDVEYDKVLANFGEKSGAVFLARAYATFWVGEAKKYANTQAGTSVEYENRAAEFRILANDILSGKVSISDLVPFSGAILIGPMQTGLCDGEQFDRTGLWPRIH